MSKRQPLGRRVNAWLAEAPGEIFRDGKWRFWFPALIGFSILNAVLTAAVFRSGSGLAANMGGVILGVGALLAWLGVGALHYSDSHDARLARGVSALDSITLIFVIAHFCFLLWVVGHASILKAAEADYKASVERYNAKAEKVSADNVAIAQAAQAIAAETTKAEKLRNDTAYQTRKAAEAGARFPVRRSAPTSGSIAPSLSTAPIELEKPADKPADTSAAYLARWDSWIRITNFCELALAAITLIFIRNRSAATNSPAAPPFVEDAEAEAFPRELDTEARASGRRESPRLTQTIKSDSGRQSPVLRDQAARKDALKVLREHLKAISFYNPGRWFKADLVRGGVTIRLFEKQKGHEIAICQTTQSDKLLAAVERPDFRKRLIEELIYQGFPLDRAG